MGHNYGHKILNETDNNTTVPASNVEQDIGNDELRATKATPLNSRVSIHVHSIRKRLADIDGISAKAAIDGLVHAGILTDDSPKEVSKISYSQEKGPVEMTIIELEW